MLLDLGHNHKICVIGKIQRNLGLSTLCKKILERKEAVVSQNGAIVVYTGRYTGRAPTDRFIVDTPTIHNDINWGKINLPISEDNFHKIYQRVIRYLIHLPEFYIFDGYAGRYTKYNLSVRVISEFAFQSLFARHLLFTDFKNGFTKHIPDLTIIAIPSCLSDPASEGTNSGAFIILNLEEGIVLIGGTKYCGEIKKSIFTFLNFWLPQIRILPMHCSANVGKNGRSALFFGLSGTGKTTLSTDPDRKLVGDDEHGWCEEGVFNFESGCYAKCINLSEEKEPQIYRAIRKNTLVENVVLRRDKTFDFADASLTENTRAAYPLHFIKNVYAKDVAPHPSKIIFLAADALGILPPVARLSLSAALYYFLSGYTSKLAGTETGVVEPKTTFSECFGAPFMPYSPIKYAQLLKKYILAHKTRIFLINTGWFGGSYGIGERISIKDTRNIINAILSGKLDKCPIRRDTNFNLDIPAAINGISSDLLTPRNLWKDKNAYDFKVKQLVEKFAENFRKFKNVPDYISSAGPSLN